MLLGLALTAALALAEEPDAPLERPNAEPPADVSAPTRPVEVHAWAKAGYMAAFSPEAPMQRGAYLSLARLQLRLNEDTFAAFLQVGADRGELELLDARATWMPTPALSLRAGRFKTPVSAEFLVPATQLIFVHRSLHTAVVPKRALGAEAEGHLRGGDWDLGLQLGVFNPSGTTPDVAIGERFTARTLLQMPLGFGLHLAASTWQHDDRALERLGEEAPLTDSTLDSALLFEQHGWTAMVEGVVAHTVASDDWATGGVGCLAHRFPTAAEGLEVEPAAAVEFLRTGPELERVGQLTLNVHKSDWNLMQTVEWEVRTSGAALENTVFVQLQAGV